MTYDPFQDYGFTTESRISETFPVRFFRGLSSEELWETYKEICEEILKREVDYAIKKGFIQENNL